VLLGIVPGVPTAEPATAPLIPTTQVHPGAGPPALVAIPGAPKVDGYEIHDELGRGGMGIVYKARHVALNRLVALKMALPGVTVAPEAQERIRLEAEAVAHLQHPNIVQIYEAGSQDGRRYFSLEFVPGGTLARKLGGDPQPSDAAARMVRTLARAVHAAHGRGVVHRDLKPANVLLAEDGTPKIADFGLAKRLDVAEGLSLSGEVKGTPSYMAPEQAAGKTREVGPAADIHALGAILYKMLTGRPPFKAATIEATLAQVIDQEPVPPGRLLPRLPRDVETICLKCLEKDPSRRYATAEALAEDLRRFLDGEPIVARPVGAAARALKWARRRPAEAALVAVLTLAVPGALIGVLVHREQQAQFRLRDLTRAAAERQRLLELRAAVQARMLEGQGAVAREDWPDAKLHLTTALNLSRPEPTLADLGARAASLLEQVDPRLDDQARRTDAVKRLATFRTRRDDALFRATLVLFTGRVRAADLEATRAAARAALALFGVGVDPGAPTAVNVSSLEADEPAEVNAGCYEMLLTLAEAEAQVLPGQSPERARDGAERALRLLDRAARLGPDTRAAHLRRARYLAQLGDPSGAARERRRAAEVDPSTATDFYLVGDEARRDGDLKAALRDFEEALTRQPDHFWATFGQASCRMRLGRWDAAVASLTACLGRRPDFAWLYPLRALAHAELREFDAAEADLNKAADHTLDDYTRYSLLVSRAVVRLARGDDPAAVVDLEAAITLRPDWHQARVNLAQVEL
ncbi:MAG TPA: protein kinase, partial [Isosphaeraceae bacterium]